MAIEFEPTSLKRGEGLVDGRLGVVEGEMGECGGGGWVEDERNSTVMGLIFD